MLKKPNGITKLVSLLAVVVLSALYGTDFVRTMVKPVVDIYSLYAPAN